MTEWLTDAYIRLILNLRVLFDNPTGNETVQWLRFLSLVLLAVLMLRLGADQLGSRRLRQRCSHCRDPRALGLLNRAALSLGMNHPPALLLTKQRWPLAFSHGIAKPAVFLAPILLNRLSPSELEAVITHEAVHIARRDSLRYWGREVLWVILPLLLVQAVAVRFIFSAEYSRLAWWGGLAMAAGFRALISPWDRLRERSCDDQTIGVTNDPLALARALLKTNRLGQELAGWEFRPASIRAFVHRRPSMAGRIRRLINYRQPWLGPGSLRIAKSALAGFAGSFLLFSLYFYSAEENQDLIGSVWAAPCPSVLLVE